MAGILELRERPGLVARIIFRMPLPMYEHGLGWIFRHAFLLLDHRGRRSGHVYHTALKVLTYEPMTREAIVLSAWGGKTDWIRNITAAPALKVTIGRESYVPIQRFLSEEEAVAIVTSYRRRHPGKYRLFCWLLGWGNLQSDVAMRAFVRSHPFVALRPAEAGAAVRHAAG